MLSFFGGKNMPIFVPDPDRFRDKKTADFFMGKTQPFSSCKPRIKPVEFPGPFHRFEKAYYHLDIAKCLLGDLWVFCHLGGLKV